MFGLSASRNSLPENQLATPDSQQWWDRDQESPHRIHLSFKFLLQNNFGHKYTEKGIRQMSLAFCIMRRSAAAYLFFITTLAFAEIGKKEFESVERIAQYILDT